MLKTLSIVALFAVLTATFLLPSNEQRAEKDKAISSIQSDLANVIEAAQDADGIPQKIDLNLDAPTAKGRYGELERFTKGIMQRMINLQNGYLQDLDAIGWDTVLDAKRLSEDVALSESRVMVIDARKLVAKYRGQIVDLPNKAKADIEKLDLPGKDKAKMLEGFMEGFNNGGALALWDLEADVVEQFANIISLLESPAGAWQLEQDYLAFEMDSDIEQFNGYLAKIDELVAQQSALQEKAQTRSMDTLSKIQ